MEMAVLIVMIVQTVVFTVTLLVLVLQVHNQVKALRTDVYNRCWSDYSALVRLMVTNPPLHCVYDDLSRQRESQWNWPKYSDQQKQLYNYLELVYELLERVFYLHQDNWIDDEAWSNWEMWLSQVVEHPIFADVAHDNRGMFGGRFEEFVLEKIERARLSVPAPS